MRSAPLLAAALLLAGTTNAIAADPPPDACTDVEATFDPACIPPSLLENLETAGRADPGYAVSTDPSPDGAWQWLVGAVHEHSGYSDGDPGSVPRDYFTAARTGVNGTGTGVALDFLWSSEHSDNGQITPTTNALCLTDPLPCAHVDDNSFWWKWAATLRQAQEATTDTFTAIRGFEWTNDFYNHMNVYFSTNHRNVKIDGSYLSMDVMWDWLQTPVADGGGADGLVTFNHPGSNPKLSPFDGDLPHAELLGSATTLDNWNEVAYVPEVADRVVGMEINGGEDIEWFIKALRNGWRLGPVAAEDHHETSWADERDHKTVLLARGRSAQDHYWALANRRTIALHADLVSGAPGTHAVVPTIDLTADGTHVLGSIVPGRGQHRLKVATSGLPAGYRVALIGSKDGQAAPVQLGTGRTHVIDVQADQWWFAVVCPPGLAPCGSDQSYSAVTAPIWFDV